MTNQLESARVTSLQAEKAKLGTRESWFSLWRNILIAVAVLAALSAFAVGVSGEHLVKTDADRVRTTLAIIAIGILAILAALWIPIGPVRAEILSIDSQIDLQASTEAPADQQRAEKLFRNHHLELQRYYDLTLRHSAWIFLVGVLCILAGFAVIGVTFYLVVLPSSAPREKNAEPEQPDLLLWNRPNRPAAQREKNAEPEQQRQSGVSDDTTEKIIVAAIGAVGAILANFIAAVYLKMFSETVKSLTDFHQRLVTTNHLHFGNFLVTQISDDKVRDATLSAVITQIAGTSRDSVTVT